MSVHEFSDHRWQSIIMPLCKAILNANILAFHKADLAESFAKSDQMLRLRLKTAGEQSNNWRCKLLRTRALRPCYRRAAKRRYENSRRFMGFSQAGDRTHYIVKRVVFVIANLVANVGFGVKTGSAYADAAFPFYPRQQTSVRRSLRSVSCQSRKLAPQRPKRGA